MNPSRRFLIRHSTFFILLTLLCSSLLAATQTLAQDLDSKAQTRIVPLFREARQAEQRRDFAEAARLYDQVLRIDPGIAEVWTNMGLCLHELSKHREAAKAFAKAAEIKPRLLVPHLFLGIEYLKLNQPEKAVSSLRSALSIEPKHPQATYELANACVRLEQFEEAVKLYRQLLRGNPEMEEAWYRLGIAYLNWSRSAARKLIDSSDPSGFGKILLAELQAVAGRRQEAESTFQTAVAAKPDLVEGRLAFGLFYLESPAASSSCSPGTVDQSQGVGSPQPASGNGPHSTGPGPRKLRWRPEPSGKCTSSRSPVCTKAPHAACSGLHF